MSTDAKKEPGQKPAGRVSRRVECLGPGKNVLMPDIYTDEEAANEPEADALESETLDEPATEFDTSEGFNPYDTGSLYKK